MLQRSNADQSPSKSLRTETSSSSSDLNLAAHREYQETVEDLLQTSARLERQIQDEHAKMAKAAASSKHRNRTTATNAPIIKAEAIEPPRSAQLVETPKPNAEMTQRGSSTASASASTSTSKSTSTSLPQTNPMVLESAGACVCV